jgi:hypothetical protein
MARRRYQPQGCTCSGHQPARAGRINNTSYVFLTSAISSLVRPYSAYNQLVDLLVGRGDLALQQGGVLRGFRGGELLMQGENLF